MQPAQTHPRGTASDVADVTRTVTRVALVVFGALTVLCFTQMRPKYQELVANGYTKLANNYDDESRLLAQREMETRSIVGGPQALSRIHEIDNQLGDVRKK